MAVAGCGCGRGWLWLWVWLWLAAVAAVNKTLEKTGSPTRPQFVISFDLLVVVETVSLRVTVSVVWREGRCHMLRFLDLFCFLEFWTFGRWSFCLFDFGTRRLFDLGIDGLVLSC